jgi:hypothetical protein
VARTTVRDLEVDYCRSANLPTVIQTIANTNSLFSGVGSYPLDGGYI